MKIFGFVFAMLLSLALSPNAYADAAAQYAARAHLEPAGPVMPGQPVKLVVDAITTTWFTAAPVFPPIDVPGAIVSPPGDDTTKINEDIKGVRWFGVSRTYIVTPQAGGDLAIPQITLVLQVGQLNGQIKARTAALKLTVKVVARPAGAEDALATSRLQVTQTLDRKLDGLKQGDAFTRSITVSADGVQSMLLPPATFAALPGLAVYPKAATLQDITKERQGFLGSTRTDAATYVAQRAGDYELPGVNIAWWDTRANQLRTAQIPPLKFSVAANPDYKPAVALPTEASKPQAAKITHIDTRLIGEIAMGAVALLLALWFLLPRLWRAFHTLLAQQRKKRNAYRNSEAAAYAKVRGAASSQLLAKLYAWLDRLAPETHGALPQPAGLNSAAKLAADANVSQVIEQLLTAHYQANTTPQSPATLQKVLHKVRSRLLARKTGAADKGLAPLNPD